MIIVLVFPREEGVSRCYYVLRKIPVLCPLLSDFQRFILPFPKAPFSVVLQLRYGCIGRPTGSQTPITDPDVLLQIL